MVVITALLLGAGSEGWAEPRRPLIRLAISFCLLVNTLELQYLIRLTPASAQAPEDGRSHWIGFDTARSVHFIGGRHLSGVWTDRMDGWMDAVLDVHP